jgi:hypothetical protein
MDNETRVRLEISNHTTSECEYGEVPYETQSEIPSKPELGKAIVLILTPLKKNGLVGYQNDKKALERAFERVADVCTVIEAKEKNWGGGELQYFVRYIMHKNED